MSTPLSTTELAALLGVTERTIQRKASGIHLEPHQLRDTFASIMIAAGIGEIELSEMLAHKSLETTRRNYGRLFAARRVSLAGRANEILHTLG